MLLENTSIGWNTKLCFILGLSLYTLGVQGMFEQKPGPRVQAATSRRTYTSYRQFPAGKGWPSSKSPVLAPIPSSMYVGILGMCILNQSQCIVDCNYWTSLPYGSHSKKYWLKWAFQQAGLLAIDYGIVAAYRQYDAKSRATLDLSITLIRSTLYSKLWDNIFRLFFSDQQKFVAYTWHLAIIQKLGLKSGISFYLAPSTIAGLVGCGLLIKELLYMTLNSILLSQIKEMQLYINLIIPNGLPTI